MITDLVILTCGRVDLFTRTMAYIGSRTNTPYRLHVIDDFITRRGVAANMRTLQDVTTSDPIVCVDDDILCPKLDPDWLALGLAEMAKRPMLGMLTLNNPQANLATGGRHVIERGPDVTTCKNVGNTFLFIRRCLLGKIGPSDKERHPIKAMCLAAAALGYDVGYLTSVYCQHTGALSVRRKRDYTEDLQKVYPVNSDTLEPPDAYKS